MNSDVVFGLENATWPCLVVNPTGGVTLANALSGKALQVGFALFTLVVAVQLVRKTARTPQADSGGSRKEV